MQKVLKRADKAIQQLQLRVNKQSHYDRYQLADVLVQILDYPDLDQADKHKKANRMGNFDLIQVQKKLAKDLSKHRSIFDDSKICQCCGLIVHQQTIPYWTRLENINVGLGTTLYFNNILYTIMIFALAVAIYSIYFIITNVIACDQRNVQKCGIEGLGLNYKILNENDNQKQLRTSSILGIVLVSIWGLIEVIKNYKQKKIAIQITGKFLQASQFTLMLQNVPISLIKQTYEQNLASFQNIFRQYEKRMPIEASFQVVKINIARNLYVQRQENKQKREQLDRKLRQKQQLFKDWIMERRDHNRFKTEPKQREQEYEDYLEFKFVEYDEENVYKGKQDQTVIVFVTILDSKARQEIQQNTRSPDPLNFFNICHTNFFPIPGVKISKAPPPEQIKWTNIGFPYKTKLLRVFLVYGVALLLLAGSLAITYGLNQAQNSSQQTWVSIIISLVITVVNVAFEFTIMILSKFLNQFTQTNVQWNIAFKICFFEILNVIGVPLLALYIAKRDLYGANGLSTDIFFIALFNILPPIGRFVDPFYLLVSLRNWAFQKADYRLKNFNGQKQFNKIYQDNDFDLGYQYAYIIKTSIFTSFFMCLQPIIAFFAIVGLVLMYFVNKYRILYRFFKPRYYSQTVNTLCNYLLNLSPMMFALGMLVFINWQTDHYLASTLILNWIIFIIGGGFLFFPFRAFYRCLKGPQYPPLKYTDVKAILPSQYDRMNPVSKDIAIHEHRSYLRELQARNKLSDNACLANQSLIRPQQNELRRTKIFALQNLRHTIRKSKNEEEVLRKSKIGGSQISKVPQNYNLSEIKKSKSNIEDKPSYNNAMESYQNLVIQLGRKDQI